MLIYIYIFFLIENITSKTQIEKLKERIALHREKRNLETKLQNVKKLNEGSDSDDDISKWVEKNRKIVSEKEQAEKRVSISFDLELRKLLLSLNLMKY